MTTAYDPWLVLLSVVVAMTVSYTALRLAARVATHSGRQARIWLAAGAVAMGVGIWSMHFIGMLAYSLPIRLAYDLPRTLASLAIAVVTSGFALGISSGVRLTVPRLAASSLIMGAGIASMHYMGMAAIAMVPAIGYDPALAALSVLIAVLASCAALWLFHRLRDHHHSRQRLIRLAAAGVMGIAISGMHYVGMAAARIAPGSFCRGGITLDTGWLATTIGLFALCLLLMSLITAVYDAHLQSSTLRHAEGLQRVNAELQFQSSHDWLTGLPNRVQFRDRLGEAIERAGRDRTSFAVLMVDLDRFKVINDTLGHGIGDRLLAAVGERLTGVARPADTVARLSGDEFLMLIDEIAEPADAAGAARSVIAALDAPFSLNSGDLHTSASIGISVFPDDGADPDTLIAHADEAMYHAKSIGRNTFQFFNADRSAVSQKRLDLEADLRRALAQRQFELHYQPKFDVASDRMIGVEALLRWRHPVRGMVPPGEFIGLAEETGLVIALGEWALREACRQARRWRHEGLPFMRIAVNISPVHFRRSEFLDTVRAALRDNDLDPQYLEIELTESTVMDDAQGSIAILEELSRMGVVVSIDDFGTGYSSMGYLRRFPIDKLKIDRSFISDLTTSTDAQSIVGAIISLAHGLRLRVIAEGVETPQQLDRLRALGCDQYQGFLRSAAVAPATIALYARLGQSLAPAREQDQFLRTHSKLAAYRGR